MTFEEANKELEAIVAKLENGTTLDEGVKLFERATELTKFCYGELDNVKGKITVIKEELDKITEEEMK